MSMVQIDTSVGRLENDHGRRELEDRHSGCFVALVSKVHGAPGVYVTEADV